jgi:hypothetical protein
LIKDPNKAAYNCLAVAKLAGDTRPRLQLVSAGYIYLTAIRVKRLSVMTSAFIPNVGRVLLSHSHKQAWLDNGYCHKLKAFKAS